MTSDKVEKYRALELKRQSVLPGSPDENAILDEMDTVWYSMSNEEIVEIDQTGAPFRDALKRVNEQHGEVFKWLAQKLAEAADGVLSPCDDSEKARGYCVGHGGITRLPCEFAELRVALDAFRAGLTKS
jgi:hypothetical protein